MRIVKLEHSTPLAQGSRRLVFQHPEHPDLVVKVLKPGSTRPDGQPQRRRWYKLRRREGAYIYHRRELTEYLAARVANGSPHGLPICAVLGLVETDLGPGLVTERVKGPVGGLAPTLRQVVDEQRFDRALRRLFERFIEDMIEKHVVVHELSVDNIVLADDECGRRFVCVDGMGSRTLIPVHEWSKWLNARKIRQFRAAVLRSIDGAPRLAPLQQMVRGFKLLRSQAPAALLALEILC